MRSIGSYSMRIVIIISFVCFVKNLPLFLLLSLVLLYNVYAVYSQCILLRLLELCARVLTSYARRSSLSSDCNTFFGSFFYIIMHVAS